MALDKNGKVLNDYTYEIAKMAVSEGRDELVFLYNGVEYYICVSNDALIKKFCGANTDASYHDFDDSFNPYWCCCTENDEVILIASKETIMDKVHINGQSLEEIWSKIVLL